MRYLVVYESAFGNTREVAEAVAAGLGGEAEVVDVGATPPLAGLDVDLLVVGGPTLRALGCTLVADPEKFWVHGDRGPLLDGEVERARQWGAGLR
ncbi:flavodoxin family protein [Ornithinimicrobium flavum]|uniref:flavodoxin family protein n=1 Tax=Ornithinimicrobium flavum TaxID=1288636 RepID=UPI001070265C|nr:flavodoxin family protein [Ornithinimicrobium flavum]